MTSQRALALDVLVSADERRAALVRDVQTGLVGPDKHLPPVWFYDETGSRLFDEITRLPEYYPTRTERAILATHADAIAAAAGADTLVEVGSGTSEKTRLLLDAMSRAGRLRHIVLLDISEEVLREAASTLADSYDLDVYAVVGDFRHHIPAIRRIGERRLWVFLGGTIGNLRPRERGRLLFDFDTTMAPGDHLLLGTDLVKDVDRMVAAYNDAAGVTAQFNRNVLRLLNRELDAQFPAEQFTHRARWNAEQGHIEMRLAAGREMTVRVRDLDLAVHLAAGEEILTETSAKFTPDQVIAELHSAGLVAPQCFCDPARDFQLTLTTPRC